MAIAMPPLNLASSSGVTAGFDGGVAGSINFGDYFGGAATTGTAPAPTVASIANNSVLMIAVVVASVLIFAPRKKKKGRK